MNDAHYPKQALHPYHSTFWRAHPEWRLAQTSLDYGRKEVRDHYLALIGEILNKFDMDGLELDFMRHGYYFRPEETHGGRRVMTEFVREVRRLSDRASRRLRKPVPIAVRVPSTPWISAQRGLDAVAWARSGLVDLIVASPWWASTQSDVPVETWCLASTTFSGWRQLFLPIDDNYSFDITSSSSTLILTGAEDKALQGCTLSADSGARPGGAG
jgi:uncharacterized lipoprotein YddW (UPF0748 family)